jgi:hypothetical protein
MKAKFIQVLDKRTFQTQNGENMSVQFLCELDQFGKGNYDKVALNAIGDNAQTILQMKSGHEFNVTTVLRCNQDKNGKYWTNVNVFNIFHSEGQGSANASTQNKAYPATPSESIPPDQSDLPF